jgi:hypothetical protein
MIKLIEVCESNRYTGSNAAKQYSLREVFINPEHIVCIREDGQITRSLKEGNLPDGLDDRTRFSRLHLNRGQNGLDITVVGDPSLIREKVGIDNKRSLLKG